jgi:hypothetical protein
MLDNLLIEFHHDRSLAIKLKQVGNIDGIEIIQASSESTLSTMHESDYDYETMNDSIQFDDDECQVVAHDDDVVVDDDILTDKKEPFIIQKNKLYDSLPSMEWSNAVDKIASKRKRAQRATVPLIISETTIRETFNRRYGKETRDEAFEHLYVLNELEDDIREVERSFDFDDEEEDYENEQHVINARKSQLRRTIFKLQRNQEFVQ